VSVTSAPSNARREVGISYSTHPNAQMSERLSASLPFACSGLMYAALPINVPTPITSAGDVMVAERGEYFGFALKPREPFGIGGKRLRKDLQSDIALQAGIARAAGMSPSTVVAVTTMLRLNPRQRAVLANKVPDMANIVAGAIVLGAVGEPRVTWPVLAGGIAFWAGALLSRS
jgi:hypothetical protein